MWFHAAEILAGDLRWNEALTYYGEAVEADTNFSMTYFGRGIAKAVSGDPAEAARDFAHAMHIQKAREAEGARKQQERHN